MPSLSGFGISSALRYERGYPRHVFRVPLRQGNPHFGVTPRIAKKPESGRPSNPLCPVRRKACRRRNRPCGMLSVRGSRPEPGFAASPFPDTGGRKAAVPPVRRVLPLFRNASPCPRNRTWQVLPEGPGARPRTAIRNAARFPRPVLRVSAFSGAMPRTAFPASPQFPAHLGKRLSPFLPCSLLPFPDRLPREAAAPRHRKGRIFPPSSITRHSAEKRSSDLSQHGLRSEFWITELRHMANPPCRQVPAMPSDIFLLNISL